jgi:hypothetical protein
MTKFSNKNRGFVKIVIVIVGALVLLKYIYDIDVIGFLTQGRFKELLDQFYNLGTEGWEKYGNAVITVWNYIIDLAKNLIDKMR